MGVILAVLLDRSTQNKGQQRTAKSVTQIAGAILASILSAAVAGVSTTIRPHRIDLLIGEFMSWHSMIISEADPHHTGFIRKYYAMVDVVMSGTDWIWRQVDAHGNYVGNVSAPFPTEDAAKDDALTTLNGDAWE